MIKGTRHSKETRIKMSEAHLGEKNHNYGKHRSAETRRKISEANKGEKHNLYGKHHSEETCKKISEAQTEEKNSFYGKHHSEETREKMSEAAKGRHLSEETRRKISEGNTRKHFSEEMRKKLSKAHKGENCTEEIRRRLSEMNKGEKNWNWKGGISYEPYCLKFNFRLKERIREKYRRKCFLCGKTEKENGSRLSVHHVDSDKMQGCNSKEWLLIPLCKTCHGKVHHDRKMNDQLLDKLHIYDDRAYFQPSQRQIGYHIEGEML